MLYTLIGQLGPFDTRYLLTSYEHPLYDHLALNGFTRSDGVPDVKSFDPTKRHLVIIDFDNQPVLNVDQLWLGVGDITCIYMEHGYRSAPSTVRQHLTDLYIRWPFSNVEIELEWPGVQLAQSTEWQHLEFGRSPQPA
jgi:hypothetical protein